MCVCVCVCVSLSVSVSVFVCLRVCVAHQSGTENRHETQSAATRSEAELARAEQIEVQQSGIGPRQFQEQFGGCA